MTRRTRTLVIGIAAALVAIVAAQMLAGFITRDRTPLTRFSSNAGRFSMMLPPGVAREFDTVQTEFSTIEVTKYKVRSKFVQFLVSYFDYPRGYMERNEPAQILKNAAKGAVSNFEGKLLDERAFLHDNTAAREVKAKAGQGIYMRCRVLLIGNRMYQLMALSTRRHISDRKVDEAFNSLDVLPKPSAGQGSMVTSTSTMSPGATDSTPAGQ